MVYDNFHYSPIIILATALLIFLVFSGILVTFLTQPDQKTIQLEKTEVRENQPSERIQVSEEGKLNGVVDFYILKDNSTGAEFLWIGGELIQIHANRPSEAE